MIERIGKYEIKAELGGGGFGVLYRGWDADVRRNVAIKLLKSEPDKAMKARFRDEAAATGNLRHPNIVTLYDSGEHDGKPYLVMEFLDGEDLQKVIRNRRPISLLEKVRIMSQVAEALHYAHGRGVLHRDVKPANIMLLPDGTVKVLDFGIASLAQAEFRRISQSRLTPPGSILGTVHYMPPEMFRDGFEFDVLGDVYSYGLTYYELVTGVYPFDAPELARILFRITLEEARAVRELIPECPAALASVIQRAMSKKREERYESLAEARLDFEPIRIELQKQQAAKLIPEVRALIDGGNQKAAQAKLREILDLDPGNPEFLNMQRLLRTGPEPTRVQTIVPATAPPSLKRLASMEFVRIPAGVFLMGCSPGDDECSNDEKPAHQVRITKAFEMGKFPVTQAQWEEVVGRNPSHFKGPKRPVERVSWNEVQKFLSDLTARGDGYHYRLPTEAEWEYAARAGSTTRYCFGDDEAMLPDYAWFGKNSGGETHPVGQKQPNAWGLYDVHGNVWEWCQDWYAAYEAVPLVDPAGPASGMFRVVRGASFFDVARYLRAAYRDRFEPGFSYYNLGFRCVREVIP